jgi:Protein of unknown function (DUF1688).
MNITSEIPLQQTAAYLRTLPAIRERCRRVFDIAKQGTLEYFDYHPEKEPDVTAFCMGIIKVSYRKHSNCLLPSPIYLA